MKALVKGVERRCLGWWSYGAPLAMAEVAREIFWILLFLFGRLVNILEL